MAEKADRRLALDDTTDATLAALLGHQATIWTALPAIVTRWDAAAMTVRCVPTIQCSVRKPDGAITWVSIPELQDCPVLFPSGGGFTLTFDISVGDEVLVIFASRCIDAWWASGGVQQQLELRMHDLSDGFALPSVRSKPRALNPAPAANMTVLRSDDNAVRVEVRADNRVRVVAPTEIILTAPTMTLNGNVTLNGNLNTPTGTITSQGKVLHSHVHSGVDTGPSNTGAPV